MFEKLFKRPSAIARQLEAPLASERASFLAQRAEEGAARDTLVRLSRELLVVVRELDLTSSYSIPLAAVETAAERRGQTTEAPPSGSHASVAAGLFRPDCHRLASVLGPVVHPGTSTEALCPAGRCLHQLLDP
jgi:hypothetical protein